MSDSKITFSGRLICHSANNMGAEIYLNGRLSMPQLQAVIDMVSEAAGVSTSQVTVEIENDGAARPLIVVGANTEPSGSKS